jgi:16S rRNA U516 pseudouridylate synthase RsuA-like enzyme
MGPAAMHKVFLVYKLTGELSTERDPEGKGRALLLDRCKSMGLPIRLPSPQAPPPKAQTGEDGGAEPSLAGAWDSVIIKEKPGAAARRATRAAGLGSVHVVSPLDRSGEGLVVLTHDGVLAQYLSAGIAGARRVYRVRVRRPLPEHAIRSLGRGFVIPGRDLLAEQEKEAADAEAARKRKEEEGEEGNPAAGAGGKGSRGRSGGKEEEDVPVSSGGDRTPGERQAADAAARRAAAAAATAGPLPLWRQVRAASARGVRPMSIQLESPSSSNALDRGSGGGGGGGPSTKASPWYTVVTYTSSVKDIRDGFAKYGSDIVRLVRTAYGPFELGSTIPVGGALELTVPRHLVSASRRFAELKKEQAPKTYRVPSAGAVAERRRSRAAVGGDDDGAWEL